MFDLEGAIDQWRERLTWRDGLNESDIEEMEGHLRDEIEALVAEGHSEQKAFFSASIITTRAEACSPPKAAFSTSSITFSIPSAQSGSLPACARTSERTAVLLF